MTKKIIFLCAFLLVAVSDVYYFAIIEMIVCTFDLSLGIVIRISDLFILQVNSPVFSVIVQLTEKG